MADDVLGAWPECSDPTSRPKLWPAGSAAVGAASDGWLDTLDAQALIAAYGIAWPGPCESDPNEAEAARSRSGARCGQASCNCSQERYRGVRLGVATPTGAATAVQESAPTSNRPGCELHRFSRAGADRIGTGDDRRVNRDPLLGSLVMVGLGARWSSCFLMSLCG